MKAYWQPISYMRDGVLYSAAPGHPDLVFYRCSHCLNTADGNRTPFCPWCGAEMNEEENVEE